MSSHYLKSQGRLSRRSLLTIAAGLGAGAMMPGVLGGCSADRELANNRRRLAFMYWGSSYEDAELRNMLERFERRTSVATTPLFTPGTEDQFGTKLNVLVASDSMPDVLYAHAALATSLAERGLAYNLYPSFDRYPELAERLPGTYYFWDHDKCLGSETGATLNCLYYLKPAFDDAGIDYPPARVEQAWSWDQFLEAADRLTVDDNGAHPSDQGFRASHVRQFGVSGFFNNFAWYAFVRANGGDITNAAGTQYTLDSPEAIEALQHLQDLIHRHRVSPFPKLDGSSGADTSTDFRSRRVAMAFDGTWAMLNLNKENIDYGIGVHPRHQQSLSLQRSGASLMSAATPLPRIALDFYLSHNNPAVVKDLFTSGLWMPLEKKYYTEEKFIDYWTDNDSHPPEFRTAVVDYILTNSVTSFDQRLRNMASIRDVLVPAIESIQQGRESAATICKGLRDKIQPLLAGAYPNPMVPSGDAL